MYSTQQYAEALYAALHEVSPKDHDTVIENFIAVLRDANALDKYEAIIDEYEQLDRAARGVTQGQVTMAHDIELTTTLVDHLNTVAKQRLELTTKVDPSILGGVILKVDDTLIDGSVKKQLDDLKKSMTS